MSARPIVGPFCVSRSGDFWVVEDGSGKVLSARMPLDCAAQVCAAMEAQRGDGDAHQLKGARLVIQEIAHLCARSRTGTVSLGFLKGAGPEGLLRLAAQAGAQADRLERAVDVALDQVEVQAAHGEWAEELRAALQAIRSR